MNNVKSIDKKLVTEKNRQNFLPKHVKKNYIQFENILFYLTESMCHKYTGGYWDFYELSNGGFFLALSSKEEYEIYVDGNGFNGIVSAEALVRIPLDREH